MCRRKGNFDAVRVVELHIRYISVYGIAHIVHEMRNEMIACEFVFHRERMHTIIKCWTTPFSRSISLLIWMQEQGTISSCLLLCSSIFSLPLLLFPLSFHNYLSISNCSVAVQFRVAQSKETKWKEKKKKKMLERAGCSTPSIPIAFPFLFISIHYKGGFLGMSSCSFVMNAQWHPPLSKYQWHSKTGR